MNSELTTTRLVLNHSLNRQKKTVMWWTIGVTVYTAVNVLAYPSLKNSILLQTENYPPALIEAFGLSNLDQLGPYIYAQVFLALPLILAFLPVTLFSGALAGAEERGGLDVILTQPMKRRTLVLASWVTALVCVAVVLFFTALFTWICVLIINETLGFADILLASWTVFPVTMAVGTIGLLLSAIMRSRGAVLGASIAIIFLLYLVEVIGKIVPELDDLRWISPFRYFNDVFSFHVPWWHYALLLGLSTILMLISVRIFDRKDIYT